METKELKLYLRNDYIWIQINSKLTKSKTIRKSLGLTNNPDDWQKAQEISH